MQDLKRWLPGAIISLGLIAAILYFVDIPAMLAAIRGAHYRILAAAMGLSFVWMMIRAKVWHTLLRGRPSYRDVLFTTGEGFLLNNFLPFRLGELGRVLLLSQKSKIPSAQILPTVVIERAMDLVISAAIFLAALPFVVGAEGAERIGYIVGAIVVVGFIVMYVLAHNHHWALDLFHKLSARSPTLRKFGGSFLESFFTGLGVLTDGWLFARFLFWILLNWAVGLVAYQLMILAFFPQAGIVWGMFGLSAAAFGGAIPSLPGAVGTFEGALGGALTLLSGDQSASLAVALTARFYNYLNSGLIGGIGLTRTGQTLAEVYRQLINFSNKSE